MPELERLADVIEWPETPSFALPAAQPRQRRALVPALVAAAVLAVAVAFAVPDARSAILRFLHLGGVTIERVDTLPAADRTALLDALGVPVSRSDAAVFLGEPFREPGVRLYRNGEIISALLPGGVLLSELRSNELFFKKLVGGLTSADWLSLGPTAAVWINGREHVFIAPTLPPRYAGNTLLWRDGPVTFRLEGRGLTLERAETIAKRLLK
jgi:hypothetical protein